MNISRNLNNILTTGFPHVSCSNTGSGPSWAKHEKTHPTPSGSSVWSNASCYYSNKCIAALATRVLLVVANSY